MSCLQRIYHQNEFGFTRKYTCHEAVHVNFGTISLLLSKSQFSDFTLHISQIIAMECAVLDYDERCIFIPTRDCSLMFALTYNELKLLSDILDQTLLMIQVDDLLSVNE